MDLVPGIQVTDKVTLARPLGEGAMGSVWIATHSTLKTEVAVKFIAEELTQQRPEAAERFTREATAAAQIKSPHVVQMFDHGVMSDGTPYIVMELLSGESLHDRLDQEGVLAPELVADILLQVGRALDAAHACGVIHRDIKPHNIFLLGVHAEPFVKVLDFGIAKQMRLGEELTEPGTIVGTPQYVCRDLIMGGDHRTVNEQADLWAMAVVAYKALTGALPFDGDSIGKICAALAAGLFALPSTVESSLDARYDRWFERAFAPEPSQRFASAGELAASFVELVSGSAADGEATTELPAAPTAVGRAIARDDSDQQKTELWRPGQTADQGRGRAAIASVAVGGMLLGAVIGIAIYQRPPPSAAPNPSTTAPLATTTAAPQPAPSAPPSPSHGSGGDAPSAAPSTSTVAVATSSLASATASGVVRPPPPLPEDMVSIPGGTLWMGCSGSDPDCRQDEKPGRQVAVDGFLIDRTEVTVIDYAKCVIAGDCSDRRVNGYALDGDTFVVSTACNWKQPRREHHPINCVSHAQARRYCEWRGARLPTEAEWERAARGDDRRRYPWGDEEPSCLFAVMADEGDDGCGRKSSWAVGRKTRDRSPYGVSDLAGNVREWVADWYAPDYYPSAPVTSPGGPEHGERRVTRGGGWGNVAPHLLRVSARQSHEPRTHSAHVGFRCARSPAP